MAAEYIAGKINSFILHLLFRRFYRLKNPNILQSDKALSQQPQKIFYPFISTGTATSDSYEGLLRNL